MANSSDEEEAGTEERFKFLCRDLNMDEETEEEAWKAFQRISTNYTLEVCLLMFQIAFVMNTKFAIDRSQNVLLFWYVYSKTSILIHVLNLCREKICIGWPVLCMLHAGVRFIRLLIAHLPSKGIAFL